MTTSSRPSRLARLQPSGFVAGALLGAAGIVMLGAADDPPPVATPVGAFQLSCYDGDNGRGAYILDTRTGELWHRGPISTIDRKTTHLGTPTKPRVEDVPLTN